ncbi:MAG TPA: TlpA disulfide reductase family protein [Pyrinomonadaceae bacterium]|nr:TlpA disulfide reductase family protein [Pyrinomonadaceae bacterium]
MKRLLTRVALLSLLAFVSAATARAQGTTGGAALKLEGQIVCSVCWFESDDRTKTPYGTDADLKCAADCAAKGIDAALAVREGEGNNFTLYMLEDGRFDKKAKDWLALMGKRVEVEGTLREAKEKKYLKVDALQVVGGASGDGAAPASLMQDAKVIGTEVEFALKDLFGTEQKLSAFRGRIVVLNFWATYCVPCRKEMPELARIQNDYAALGVQVIGASADAAEARADVLKFIKETKLNFPVWLGASVGDMQKFGLAPALPGTVIVGRDGRIVWHKSGIITETDVKREIDKLLAQAAKEEKKARRELEVAHAEHTDASSVPS